MTERTRILISPEQIEVEIESDIKSSELVEERVYLLIKKLMLNQTKTEDDYRDVG